MAMFHFLEHYDNWSGKKILPFCTNEGSGMGKSEQDLKRICSGAIVKPGLSIRGCKVVESEKKIMEWAKKQV